MSFWSVTEVKWDRDEREFESRVTTNFATYQEVCDYIFHKYDDSGFSYSEPPSQTITRWIEHGLTDIVWDFGDITVEISECKLSDWKDVGGV